MYQPKSTPEQDDKDAKQPDNHAIVAMMPRNRGDQRKADPATDQRDGQKGDEGKPATPALTAITL